KTPFRDPGELSGIRRERRHEAPPSVTRAWRAATGPATPTIRRPRDPAPGPAIPARRADQHGPTRRVSWLHVTQFSILGRLKHISQITMSGVRGCNLFIGGIGWSP